MIEWKKKGADAYADNFEQERIASYPEYGTAGVRRILAENGIDYTIKTTNMQGGMQKANMWSAGFNQSFAWEYKIYVHKKDLEYALHLIR